MKSRLWEPFRIGQMELRNRIVMAPMVTKYGSELGYVTEPSKDHYEARARGGAGLIIVEATYVHPRGQCYSNQLGLSDDKFISGMSALAQVIHKHGAKAAVQLHHGGRRAKWELIRMQPVAPSAVPMSSEIRVDPEDIGALPKELTAAEIEHLVAAYANAAVRAEKAGFDGVEIHAGHGYLIDQFISRSSNVRRDIYGGNLQNRARLLIEVIKAIREKVGTAYPVWCRINGREFGVAKATTSKEACEIARMAQEAGVDAIHVSAVGAAAPTNGPSPTFVPAVIADLAQEIRKAVSVPVIAVGRITPEAGERLLIEGKADLIAIGKGLLADPELPNKVASGRLEDITPCITCFGCISDLFTAAVPGIRCRVNATLGREAEYRIVPAKARRRVLVVGGGPGGMEAARVAALRGHQVTLWEREGKLGGQLIWAAIPPYRDRIGALIEYLETQLKKLGVKVEVNKEADAAMIEKFEPEVLALATGVRPVIPEILGLDRAHLVLASDILDDKREIGNKVTIIGGGMVGCEVAEFLADRGKKVTVVEMLPEIAAGEEAMLKSRFLDRLLKKGITLLTETKCLEANSKSVVIITKKMERKTIDADTIVIAAGDFSNRTLYEEIKEKLPEVYLVGDCIEPRRMGEAIADGCRIGLQI